MRAKVVSLKKVDGLKFVRENPKMFLSFETATGFELCSKILIDAMTSGAQPVVVDKQENWWIVASRTNWISNNADGIAASDLFRRIHPNPRAGANAMRNEILLAAFADQIVLFQDGEFEVIRGSDKTYLPQLASEDALEFKHGIAFTMPED
jgi:hypothetical protein